MGKDSLIFLKNNKIKILVLTDFHARFLSNLGIPKNRIKIFPNHLNIRSEKKLKSKIIKKVILLFMLEEYQEKRYF